MKTSLTLLGAAAMICSAATANAQQTVIVEETVTTYQQAPECKTHYSSSWRDNWFIQLGAGVQTPAVEKYLPQGDTKQHYSPVYNIGFGHWFSPYLGFRISGSDQPLLRSCCHRAIRMLCHSMYDPNLHLP